MTITNYNQFSTYIVPEKDNQTRMPFNRAKWGQICTIWRDR